MTLEARARRATAGVRLAVGSVVVPDARSTVRDRRRRRRLRGALLTFVVTLVIAAAIAVPFTASDDREVTVAAPGPRPNDGRFVPATTTIHGVVRMPVTLPDGRPFTVRYAPGLDLAGLGFRSTVASTLFLGGDHRNTQTRRLAVLHTTVAARFAGLMPVATYPDASGRPVPYYVDPAAPDRGGLVVQIGSWLVVVPDLDDPANHPDDHLTPDQLAVWARNLSGWIDRAGFPVIAPGRALTLDQNVKVSFVLGPTSTSKNNVAVGERWLCEGPGADTTTPRRFPPTPRGAAKGAAWCDQATGLHVSVVGTRQFVDGVIHSFTLAPFSTKARAAKIVLANDAVEAGSSIPGVVVVVNNTGRPLTYGGCGRLFGIALTKPGKQPEVAWYQCLQQLTIPAGESSFPASVMASATSCTTPTGCPLAPGKYEAVFVQDGSDFPVPARIPVRVTAAPR